MCACVFVLALQAVLEVAASQAERVREEMAAGHARQMALAKEEHRRTLEQVRAQQRSAAIPSQKRCTPLNISPKVRVVRALHRARPIFRLISRGLQQS